MDSVDSTTEGIRLRKGTGTYTMKIAQIAPLVESVPPAKYGGTERVISALTEELLERGHDVTLFASGDSVTSARLDGTCKRSLRSAGITDIRECMGQTLTHIGYAYSMADQFDVIHDHCGVLSFPTAQICNTPVISTMHGCFFDDNIQIFQTLQKPHVVTISHDQAASAKRIHRVATVHNGLPMEHYPFEEDRGDYLLYVGRISPLKGTAEAITIAKATQRKLIIAAKLDQRDVAYFEAEVKPHLSDQIQWIGEVSEKERNRLMSKAYCFIHPAPWREPFGLTLIEAMACGAPVVAFDTGAIREVVAHKKTGFVVQTIQEFIRAVEKVHLIDKKLCREWSLSHFSAKKMADGYERVYKKVAQVSDQLFSTSYSIDTQGRTYFGEIMLELVR